MIYDKYSLYLQQIKIFISLNSLYQIVKSSGKYHLSRIYQIF